MSWLSHTYKIRHWNYKLDIGRWFLKPKTMASQMVSGVFSNEWNPALSRTINCFIVLVLIAIIGLGFIYSINLARSRSSVQANRKAFALT
jgi:hypothetical protein